MRFGRMSTKAASWSRLLVLMGLVAACAATRLHPAAATQGLEAAEGGSGSKWDALRMVTSSRWGLGAASAGEELETCEEDYGFFPCSTTIGGNLFLLVVYGYLLLKAAQCLSSGSELLLTVTNPGIIGGLVLPILGALPDALLILVSGLSASAATAQSEVLVGMGLLAGSNIMLLTALWGGALIVGRCDLEQRGGGQLVAKDKTLNNGWSITGTGVTTDQQTRVSSWIMVVTVLPYLVAQAPVVFGVSDTMGDLFVLVGCAISLIGLASYCTYQVAFPWIQQRSMYRAKQKVQRSRALHHISQFSSNKSWGGLLLDDGVTPNKEFLCELFKHFDVNNDDVLSTSELRGLIMGLGIEKSKDLPNEEEVKTWLKDFDSSNDDIISRDEFVRGMEKWVSSFVDKKGPRKKAARPSSGGSDKTSNGEGAGDEAKPQLFWNHNQQAESSLNSMLQDQGGDEEDEDGEKAPPTKGQVIFQSVAYLTLGAVIAGVVADPLVDAIGNFSTVTGISPFFISFVATPLASNSSEAISSLLFAMKKKRKNISMTYSQIYGGVTMNNTMCLAIFLAIVYTRGLVWDFSSEVLVILVATVIIGALASVRVTFPLWTAFVALLLYPLSIALVAILDYGFGWQ